MRDRDHLALIATLKLLNVSLDLHRSLILKSRRVKEIWSVARVDGLINIERESAMRRALMGITMTRTEMDEGQSISRALLLKSGLR